MTEHTAWTQTSRRSDAHRTLSERTFNELKAAIVSGELAPGTRLRIGELAKALDVSPMPVRDAVRRLEALGLVEHVPHRGATVSTRAPHELLDLVRARLAVEPAATALAAGVFAHEHFLAAEAALQDYERAARRDDIGAVSAADQAFHFAIYEAAGSPWFLRLIRPLWESAELYRRTGQPGKYGFDEREEEHSMILAACVAQDEALARERMAHHLKRSGNRISRSLTGGIMFPEAMGLETR
jgi:DNA-binding GntR family transcriptional regulator